MTCVSRVGWRRWAPRGVQARSALAATLVLAVVLAVASGALVLLLQRSLTSSAQESATLQAETIAGQVDAEDLTGDREGGDELADLLDAVAGRTSVAQVLDGSGDVLASTTVLGDAPAIVSPDPDDDRVQAGTERLDVRGDADDYRVVSVSGSTEDRAFVVAVGVSLESVEDARGALLVLLALGAPVLLVAVWVATSYYIGRALAPVDAITTAVAGIGDADADLRRRVPVPDADDEVAYLATTMNAMLGRLERARATQRRFVADASHELRSPVATLRAAAEVELRAVEAPHVDGSVDAEGLAPLVLAESTRRQRLVDGLLTLARVDGARPPDGEEGGAAQEWQEVDLDDLVLAERVRLRASTMLEVDADIAPVRVLGDVHDLSAVVRNLVDNAARHAASRVVLVLTVRDGLAVIEVADDGPGIEPADRDRVFERFVRLDESRQRGSGGTGLGLAIVAGIVGIHGGTVVAEEASPAPGALVRVTLPLAEPSSGTRPTSGEDGADQPATSTPVPSRA